MIRLMRSGPTRQMRRARDEAVSAWDHLRAAADNGARRIGDGSRRSKDTAKEATVRANNAAMALRGKTPRTTVRKWLGTGLAAGAVIGAATMAAIGRRRNHAGGSDDGSGTGVRDKANAAMDSVRDRATTAVHRAATSARDTAAKASEATKPRSEGNGHEPRASQTSTTSQASRATSRTTK